MKIFVTLVFLVANPFVIFASFVAQECIGG